MYYAKVANNNGNDNTNYTNDNKVKQPSGTRQKADSAPEGFLAKKREREISSQLKSPISGEIKQS